MKVDEMDKFDINVIKSDEIWSTVIKSDQMWSNLMEKNQPFLIVCSTYGAYLYHTPGLSGAPTGGGYAHA